MPSWKTRPIKIVGRAHLIYLGLLPSLATLAVLHMYGYPLPFLLFTVGVAAVGVYLAVTWSYTALPNSVLGNLWGLLDGPLFVLLGRRGAPGGALGFAIEASMIDGIAIWAAILWLSAVSAKPTPGQRVASLGIMVAILAMIGSLFWPYVRDVLWGDWLLVASLAVGCAESVFFRVRMLDAEAVVREDMDASTLYIAGLVMLWVASMIAGMVIHEAG